MVLKCVITQRELTTFRSLLGRKKREGPEGSRAVKEQGLCPADGCIASLGLSESGLYSQSRVSMSSAVAFGS